jgi:hypothetical protein
MEFSDENANLPQMDSKDNDDNVPNVESTSPPAVAADSVPVESANPLPAQYSYDNFDQALAWIAHFSNVFIDKCTAAHFGGQLKLRDYYLSQGNTEGVKSIENITKNDVGILRFEEETENFHQIFVGKCAKFWRGKFIGWQGEVPYNPSLRGVMGYEICEE